ncbi:MAG: 30S ribosomal protein S14 [Bacteroidetes bacterium QS_8_68_28]|jgi:small subunit ribosomal protein S14|nr:MAG: 30S ribosomal protein S14 [Bacteroidetes bacterium QS_8_68_28]
MAKKSQIARQKKRRRMYEKYKDKRRELKENGEWVELQKLPRNSSPTRLNNRCPISGRTRGYMREFGVSRIVFREMALEGKIPGVRKSSW